VSTIHPEPASAGAADPPDVSVAGSPGMTATLPGPGPVPQPHEATARELPAGDATGWRSALASVRAADVLRRALHPPVTDPAFWVVQATVVALTAAHLVLDHSGIVNSSAVASLPVATLFIPVAYAALRFGLHGSAATALWATLLWIPDLAIPHHHGDPGADLVSLLLIDTVAIIVGQRIERESLARSAAAVALSRRRATEARFRQLFAATRAPILLFDVTGRVLDANPAAWSVFGSSVLEGTMDSLLGFSPAALAGAASSGRVDLEVDGQPAEFRYLSSLSTGEGGAQFQVLLQDVTVERRAWRDVQAYAAALLGAQEEERARLARELHDDPLQTLLHVARRLELVGMQPGVSAEAAHRLEQAHADLLDTARRLRDLAQGLRPPALDRLGLAAALHGLTADEEHDAPGDLRLDFTVRGTERRLVPECELGLYRIAQEALHNALEHATPTWVQVSLEYEASLVHLTVANDGAGFDPDVAPDHSQLGLRGMRERAGLLGGTLAIDSSPGGRTRVTATVPLRVAGSTVAGSEPCEPADTGAAPGLAGAGG
jgi:signal transduction histidine kinase